MIGNGPNYYRNLTAAPSKKFIGKELSIIRSKNQSRRTHDKAANLNEYRQMLSSTFEKKQYGRIIKLLAGDFPPQLDPTTYQAQVKSTSRTPSNAYRWPQPNLNDITADHPITKGPSAVTTRTGLRSSYREPPFELISHTL